MPTENPRVYIASSADSKQLYRVHRLPLALLYWQLAALRRHPACGQVEVRNVRLQVNLF